MTNEQLRKLAALRENEYQDKARSDCATAAAGCSNTTAAVFSQPTCLSARVSSRRADAEIAASRQGDLTELEYLLAKHPDVARIFDLIEITRA